MVVITANTVTGGNKAAKLVPGPAAVWNHKQQSGTIPLNFY
jgi:hypothetical protein